MLQQSFLFMLGCNVFIYFSRKTRRSIKIFYFRVLQDVSKLQKLCIYITLNKYQKLDVLFMMIYECEKIIIQMIRNVL